MIPTSGDRQDEWKSRWHAAASARITEALNGDDNLAGFGNALAGSSLSAQLSDPDAEYTIFARQPLSWTAETPGEAAPATLSRGSIRPMTSPTHYFTALMARRYRNAGRRRFCVNGAPVIDVNMVGTNAIRMINAALHQIVKTNLRESACCQTDLLFLRTTRLLPRYAARTRACPL